MGNNDVRLLILKSEVIDNMLQKVVCDDVINEYFAELSIEHDDYVKLDVLFDLFYGIFKDNNILTPISEEYSDYIYNTLVSVFSNENEYLAKLCSSFILAYFNVIEAKDVILEDKYNALVNLDMSDLPYTNYMKKMYLITMLNILVSKVPFSMEEIHSTKNELKKCID